jgi:hypothetical protein
MVGLTATEARVAEVASNFRVWYERCKGASALDGYTMDRAGYIYVMAFDGRFVDVGLDLDAPAENFADSRDERKRSLHRAVARSAGNERCIRRLPWSWGQDLGSARSSVGDWSCTPTTKRARQGEAAGRAGSGVRHK